MTAANSIQMLLHNLDCDGTQLHAPSAAHELLLQLIACAHVHFNSRYNRIHVLCPSQVLIIIIISEFVGALIVHREPKCFIRAVSYNV